MIRHSLGSCPFIRARASLLIGLWSSLQKTKATTAPNSHSEIQTATYINARNDGKTISQFPLKQFVPIPLRHLPSTHDNPRKTTALLIVTYLPPAGTHITQIFPHQPKESSSNPVPSIRLVPMTSLQHLRKRPTFCISINDLLSTHPH